LIRSRRDRTTGFGAGGGTDYGGCHGRRTSFETTDDRPFLSRQEVPNAQLFDGPFCANAGARQAVFNEGSCQRCQFHLMRNAMAHALKVAMRPEIAGNIRRFFEADA